MTTNFPHYKTSPPALHRWYILMCLQLVHSVPTLEGPVMNLLVDQALEMDVQIKINDRGSVFLDCEHHDDAEQQPVDDTITSSTKKRSYQIISHETILAVGKSNNNNNNGEASPDDTSDEITEIAERLDNLMNLLCQRIHKLTSFSSDSISEALAAVVHARRLYRHLNDIFDKKVRNTHRSKFVPFILFVLFGREHDALEAVGKLMTVEEERKNHDGSPSNIVNVDAITAWKEDPKRKGEVNEVIAASISQTDFLYRDFCAKLIDLFYNPVEAGELPSQTLVCTLASFVSRATYVCSETVCETVAAILQWVEAYIEAHSESRGSTPSLMRRQSSGLLGNATFTMKHQREIHALFYTACQSAFYIMCFRGAEALHYYKAAWMQRDNPESEYASPESVNLGAKRWKAICQHPLQPLRYCLESVRVEFLYMAEDLHLFVEESTGDDSINQQEEAKKFIQQLWSANDQKATGDKSKNTVTPKRKRSSIISTAATQEKKRIDGGVGGLGKGSNPLDSYFPFDPYLLQSSYKYLHPFYRNWEDCILTMEELNGDSDAEGSILNEEVVQDNDDNESAEDDRSVLTDSADEQEDEDDDGSDDDDEESKTKQPSQVPNSKTLEGNGLEVEIRRCRALSTGSQASW
jgi:RNA polymerase I-specific transcription initiation factor RRN3